ncbi:MAG: aminoacyl-histidine dipeptidase [Bacteroidetes bacterium]|nr:MAG: aminoacyl-histidine dipeptidase [Bacteroidota bacterium]
MEKKLTDLALQPLWTYFAEICNIPHPSKKEEKIIEYMKNFGENLGLETVVDEVGNIVIRKPATAGFENRSTIILQSHLDMVPQKNNDTEHDFDKDPIQPYIDNEWVKARGTTLGADNGIGVATAMAVLSDNTLKHGPIEALFTIDEETGMTGAFALKEGLLKGDIMLNLDSEDEGELYIGCAGGVDTTAVFPYKTVNVVGATEAWKVEVKGLKGGHSGLDIHLGRGNANKILTRILWQAHRELQLQISTIDGGSLRNAIPREASALVVVPKENQDKFESMVKTLSARIKNELKNMEPDLAIQLVKTDIPKTVIDANVTSRMLNGVYACPNGVIRMTDDMPGVVETSTNLAIIKSDGEKIEICTLQRSAVDSAKDDLCNMIRSVFEMADAEVEHSGSYPGWKPNMNSPILKTMKNVYHSKYGKTPEVKVIHAGLECGIIGGAYPNLDMISFGPTIRNPHSPDEKVNIETVTLFWDFLKETLANAPAK